MDMDGYVLHVLYLDLRRTLDHQHERLRHVRDRTSILLVAAVGVAVLLWPDTDDWNQLHLVGLAALLVVVAVGGLIVMPVDFGQIQMQLADPADWNGHTPRSDFAESLIRTWRGRIESSEEVVQSRNRLLRVLTVAFVLEACASGAAAAVS